LILFAAFPALAIPLIAWEVRRCLPARFEMDAGSARLFINGKLKEEIVFGPTVKADVTLDSNRIGPAPRAFDDSCAEGPLGPPREDFLLLCGISLAQGERSITISHDNGWRLIDFNVIWDQFFHLVVEHEMEMGSEIWRYVEFRDSFSELGDDVEPDIFGRIRALET
jgi:hypothetical protein